MAIIQMRKNLTQSILESAVISFSDTISKFSHWDLSHLEERKSQYLGTFTNSLTSIIRTFTLQKTSSTTQTVKNFILRSKLEKRVVIYPNTSFSIPKTGNLSSMSTLSNGSRTLNPISGPEKNRPLD